jgi:tetratricopeptide (TPR) repeat protein
MLQALLLAVLVSSPGQVTPTPSPVQVTPTPSPVQAASPSPSPTLEPDAPAPVSEGDAHFARRSIGAIDEIANKTEVDAAITLYRYALALAPRDVEILARLMRALHFRGAYTGAGLEERKAIFDEGRKLGQDAVDRIEAEAKTAKGMSRIEALRLVKGAPALYLWTAGHWGEWGLARGKFAAARSGIAGKLRDLAQTVIDLDPLFEEGAGYRILGRLHSEAPKIIFITGWVSHEKGLEYLRRAYQIGPRHPVTWYFLAEATLDHEPERRDEAIRLLEMCADTPPRADTLLEDLRYATMARKQLDQLRNPPRP